jgi:hypothetical protein
MRPFRAFKGIIRTFKGRALKGPYRPFKGPGGFKSSLSLSLSLALSLSLVFEMPPEHVLVLITHAAPRICSFGWVLIVPLWSSWVILGPPCPSGWLAGFPWLLLALHGSPWICWLSPFGMAPKSSRAWVTLGPPGSSCVLLGLPRSSWTLTAL